MVIDLIERPFIIQRSPLMSAADRMVLRVMAEHFNAKWMARDKEGSVVFFDEKPEKITAVWDTPRGFVGWSDHYDTDLVSWDDEEPFNITEALESFDCDDDEVT